MAFTSYEEYQKKKKDLLEIMRTAVLEIAQLNKTGVDLDSKPLAEQANKLEQDNFKVLVIGEFKNGKSTFINALMGDKILPAYSTPCTAVINEVVYGKDKSATLYFKDPLPKEMSSDIVPKAQQHIQKYRNKGSIPPYEINVNELEDYVAIPDPSKDQADSIQELPYSKVVLKYPVELCRNGVEIIDSPGLNENETRTKVTAEYLNRADAILFVFRCPKICGINEMSYIESEIQPQGHTDIFFICNAINQIPEEERERMKKFGNKKLTPMTSLGEKGIFYVNALGALEAKRDHDTAKLAQTGMPELENALSAYLQNERGRKKLLSVIAPCSNFIDSCIQHSDEYIHTLQQGSQEFEKKVKEAMPAFELAKGQEEVVNTKIGAAMEKLPREIQDKLSKQYDKIITDLPGYVGSLDMENKITLNFLKRSDQQKELARELEEKIHQYMQHEMGKWTTNELNPFMERFIENLENDLEKNIDKFYNELDTFRFNVSGVENPQEVSGWSRLGGTIIGTLTAGPLYGLIGMEMGIGEAIKRSALPLAAALLVAISPMGMTAGLITIVLTTLVSGGLQLANAGKAMTEKFKKELARSYQMKLRESKDDSCRKYADKLTKAIREKLDVITQALRKEVDVEESKIETLRADLKKNEQDCKKKVQDLKKIQDNLKGIQQKMKKFQKEIG